MMLVVIVLIVNVSCLFFGLCVLVVLISRNVLRYMCGLSYVNVSVISMIVSVFCGGGVIVLLCMLSVLWLGLNVWCSVLMLNYVRYVRLMYSIVWMKVG